MLTDKFCETKFYGQELFTLMWVASVSLSYEKSRKSARLTWETARPVKPTDMGELENG
jgi:hypothetical protein